MAQIDFEALREALTTADGMVAYYTKDSDHKAAQNAAMEAVGLAPLHKEQQLVWDREHAAKYRRQADALRAVLAHFGADQAEAA